MKVRMKLIEDTIFGNGQSIPGEEDISLQHDEYGFPYFKGSTLKGIFREELERLLKLEGNDSSNLVDTLLGENGANDSLENRKVLFSEFVVADSVKKTVLAEVADPGIILDSFSSLRTFTKINDDGMVEPGSLRIARCVNKGISLYGEIECDPNDKELIIRILKMIKWVGTMRNRGFGRVILEVVEGGNKA